MFNYLKIISIAFYITTGALSTQAFSNPVGTVEENKPAWYAVIGTENKGKKLYVKGDIFSSRNNSEGPLRILDIKRDALILEDVASKNGIIVRPGEKIPIEGAGLIFEKTVETNVLEYNYNKPPKKLTKNQAEDFAIKSIEKNKVTLEKDIFDSPRDQNADKKIIIADLFNNIESKKTGDNFWALEKSSAEPAIRNAGEALISAIKRVEPGYRMGEGPSLKFNTELGVAVINKQGFLIQSLSGSRLSEGFGIKEGDVIKSVNGCPVNSLLGIFRVYETIASSKGTRLFSLDIVRDGKIQTLVYKIR